MRTRRIYTLGFAAALFVSLVWAALAQTNRDNTVVKVTAANDDGVRDLARLLATHEVYKLHWKKLEASTDFALVIDQLSNDLAAEQFTHRWKVSVLPTGKLTDRGADLDEFEKQAVPALHAGQDEAWQVEGDGVVRLAKAVRAKTSCLVCHQAKPDGDGLKYNTENDIIGIVTLKVYPRDEGREKEAATELKVGIDNLRQVATKYSDTKEAAAILELLKQLQKNHEAKAHRDDK